MRIKLITKLAVVIAVISTALPGYAEPVNVDGTITDATGALAVLAGPGTTFSGSFEFDDNLTSGQVILAGFCFTTDALGLPPASSTCPTDKSAVPLLAQGQTDYTGQPPAPGAVYQQAGSTFDGYSGALNLLAYSPSFNVNIAIAVNLERDGNGVMNANAGTLGTASGSFTWNAPDDPVIVPVPASVWLFSSAVFCLFLMSRRRQSFISA